MIIAGRDQYYILVYTTQVNSTFRVRWLVSLEVISQVLFTSEKPKKNKMAFSVYCHKESYCLGPLVIQLVWYILTIEGFGVKRAFRLFTQKWTWSETLHILHVVLFKCVKQCSLCFHAEVCFVFEILRMQKTCICGHDSMWLQRRQFHLKSSKILIFCNVQP